MIILMVRTPASFACIPTPEGSQFHPYIQRITHNITDEGVVHNRLLKIYYAELDECLKQYEAGINLCGDPELQFILSAICDANSPKVTREFIDGKHTDIYNELKQMALDKEAMEMLFSEELAHTDWVSMEKEIQTLENDNSDKDQRISFLMNENADKDQQLSALKEELERIKASLNS